MKKKSQIKKGITYAVIALFVGVSIVPSILGLEGVDYHLVDEDTEYWAIIFAVGIYYKHPEQNRPSMIECAENLYKVLIDSPNWQEDHIHKIIAYEATGRRLIRELLWLIRNEDSDDMSLIYLTSHGGPMLDQDGNPLDLPPKDEDDGADEVLVMYNGFDKWYAFIWDDLLNFFLKIQFVLN